MECNVLVLLVGSNPLPNYLAAATLKPSRVHLVYSPQTEQFKDRLRMAFENTLGIGLVRDFLANSATKAYEVAKACRQALEGADHLNYTGGTKVMAAQARMTFGAGRESSSSYVDEASGCIRLDNEIEISIDASTLTTALLLQLHGLEVPRPRAALPGDPTLGDAARVAECLLRNPPIASELYKTVPDPGGKIDGVAAIQWVKSNPVDLPDLGLPFRRIPEVSWTNKNIKHWMKFLRGCWLEEWTASKLRGVDAALEPMTGLNTKLDGRPLECDVLFLNGSRPFLVSCTTDDQIPQCKSKLFEVALRARQIGGDLARYALVSFMPQARVSEVQRDVAAVWDAPVQPAVFGIEHLKEWAGLGPSEPSLASLRSWIDQ
jgi:hypothetical protein